LVDEVAASLPAQSDEQVMAQNRGASGAVGPRLAERSGLPYNSIPTSWFHVAWSHEIDRGQVRPLRYFGKDLVCYRGESGQVYDFDAYCPHLGAHLGHGGTVIDDSIRCPFHGWRYECTGQNIEIPYGAKSQNPAVWLRKWPVREINGLILVWHDEDDREPTWEPPEVEEFRDEDYYPLHPHGVTHLWPGVHFQPQHVLENSADFAHLKYVHKNAEIATIEEHEPDGHRFRFRFGTTYLTPDAGEVPGTLPGEWWGMGMLIFKLFGVHDTAQIVTVTPIDHDSADMRISVVARRIERSIEPIGIAKRIMLHQIKEIERDLPIWEHMSYRARPVLAPEEARGFKVLRSWASQFYPR
jgi:3-ketosteroid 9alpha-monooxygenase subunit A